MPKRNARTFLSLAVVGLAAVGCAGAPAKPFDTMAKSQVTAYRLQNYEAPAAPAPTTPGPPGMIPGLPPQLQQWIGGGADGLGQLIPPGLVPPGVIPGVGGGAPGAPPPQTAPKFHNFRIISSTQVLDESVREDLAKLLGDDSNFDNTGQQCMYAEFGISFVGPGGQTNDMLISHSCHQVQAKSFAWPHPQSGIKARTSRRLAELWKRVFPAGT